MSQQTKTDYEGTFNSVTVGLFKNNTAGDIGADDARTLVENTADSVPFTLDDSYTWPFPQVTASGTDTYTATLSPAITAYVAGQKFQILFTNANTGAATLNLNAVGALAITKNGATALAAGDIPAGSIKILAYDGTRLQIVGDGGGGGTAATTSFTPAGGIAATDVQAAIEELDTEKAPLASPTFTGTPAAPTAAATTNTTQIATTAFVQQEINLKSDALITTRTEIASHTLDSTDLASINAGDELVIEMNLTGTANNLTVPPNATVAFPVGTFITVKQQGTGVTTIVAGSGVTITPPAGGNLISPGQGQPMILRKTGTNTWDLYNGNAAEAITKVDDTNVTLTLGGSPTTSVLSPVSFTLGWTGVLSVARGGVGADNTTQTYTPTLTNTANLAASTAYECMYSRIGNVVTVSGRVDIDPTTTATLTTLGISLPIASDFTTANQASGTAAASAVADAPAAIFADDTNNRLTLQYVCTDVTNHAMYFTATYLVV